MFSVPSHPKVFHITHLRNLAQVVRAGRLWSDAKRIELELKCDVVGLSHIKRRRLTEIEVGCHTGTRVGDYVPFYFCPRSVMLYTLHKGNHSDLNYTEGQQPIIHLQADLNAVVRWADAVPRRWAFSDGNAGARYAQFFEQLAQLSRLNWEAIEAHHWQSPEFKEGKQAEFLVYEWFPWQLVERIGVCDQTMLVRVKQALAGADHQPAVSVEPNWYY